jgi:hypothetical protein
MQDPPQPWQLLLVRIRKIYEENPDNRNYGVGRILLALEQRGVKTSRSGVRRAMKKGGLLKSPARRPQSLTKADVAAHLSHSTFLFINRINDMNMPRFHGNSSIVSVIFFATKQASYCYRPFGYLGRSLRGSVN